MVQTEKSTVREELSPAGSNLEGLRSRVERRRARLPIDILLRRYLFSVQGRKAIFLETSCSTQDGIVTRAMAEVSIIADFCLRSTNVK